MYVAKELEGGVSTETTAQMSRFVQKCRGKKSKVSNRGLGKYYIKHPGAHMAHARKLVWSHTQPQVRYLPTQPLVDPTKPSHRLQSTAQRQVDERLSSY